MDSERVAFLRAICETPDDDAPRLVYADWLDEQGDPEPAEFIRLQVGLAANSFDATERPTAEQRAGELLHARRKSWIKELPRGQGLIWPEKPIFRRGFASQVQFLTEHAWRKFADKVFELVPIDEIDFATNQPTGVPEDLVRSVLASPLFGRIVCLKIPQGIAASAVLTLLQQNSSLTGRLRSLSLPQTPLGDDEAAILSRCPGVCNLTALGLSGSRIGDRGMRAIVASPYLRMLEHVSLASNPIGNASARAIASATHWQQVRSLRLIDCAIGDEGIAALVTSPHLNLLENLAIGGGGHGRDRPVSGQWLEATVKTMTLPQLRRLSLTNLSLTTVRVRVLRSLMMQRPALQLHLAGCDLSTSARRTLEQSLAARIFIAG